MEKIRLFFERVVGKIRYHFTKADGFDKIEGVYYHFDEMITTLIEGQEDLTRKIGVDAAILDEAAARITEAQKFIDKAVTMRGKLEELISAATKEVD